MNLVFGKYGLTFVLTEMQDKRKKNENHLTCCIECDVSSRSAQKKKRGEKNSYCASKNKSKKITF